MNLIIQVKNRNKIVFTFKIKVSLNPNKELKNKCLLNKTLIIPYKNGNNGLNNKQTHYHNKKRFS